MNRFSGNREKFIKELAEQSKDIVHPEIERLSNPCLDRAVESLENGLGIIISKKEE